MGFSTYITPPTPTGVPDDTFYPRLPQEHAVVRFPTHQHLIDAEVGLRVTRVADGRVLAAWQQDVGAYRVARPAPTPADVGAASRPVAWKPDGLRPTGSIAGGQGNPSRVPISVEEVAPAWALVTADAGDEVARWMASPRVEVERPLWEIRSGPARGPMRSGLAAAQRGDWPRAETEFRAAVQAAPRDPRPHANLGVVLERRGDRAGAYASLRTAARLERSGESRFARLLHEFRRTFLVTEAEAGIARRAAPPASAPATAP